MSGEHKHLDDNVTPTKKSLVRNIKIAGEYLGVGSVSLLIASFVLNIWGKSFSTPWYRGGDVDLPLIMVRAMEKGNWFFTMPQMGAPGKSNIHDLPQGGENLQWVALKALTYFTTASGAVNWYYLMTFAVVAMVAYGSAKWWGLHRSSAFVVATLFSFLYYHFSRNEAHLLLTMYAFMPLVLVYCYKTTQGKVDLPKWKWALFVIVCACTNSYYTIFGILLIITAAIYNLVRKNRESLTQHIFLVCSMGVVFLVNLLPTLWYWHFHGKNVVVAARNYDDPEQFGLQITNMLFPRVGYRLGFISQRALRIEHAGTISEPGQAIGLIATLGILALVAYGFYCVIRSQKLHERANYFFVLSIVVVLATVSSGPVLLAGMAGFTQIRSWNRVIILIAFMGLLFAGYVYEQGIKKYKWGRKTALAILGIALVIGMCDQTSLSDKPAIAANERYTKSECHFIDRIDTTPRRHNAAFQLPFVSYPAEGYVNKLGYYSQGLPTLCNTNLRFSFGAIRGRNDDYQRDIATRYSCLDRSCSDITEINDQDLLSLRRNKFSVVIVYRDGYPDHGAKIDSLLTEQFGAPIVSSDKTQSAYVIDKSINE